MNLYQAFGGNPVNYTDPWGEQQGLPNVHMHTEVGGDKVLPEDVIVRVGSRGNLSVSKVNGKYIVSVSEAYLKVYYGGSKYKAYEDAVACGFIEAYEHKAPSWAPESPNGINITKGSAANVGIGFIPIVNDCVDLQEFFTMHTYNFETGKFEPLSWGG